MKITFLGTGTSHGVPTLDCMIDDHARCRKNVCQLSTCDPKHSRTRSSIFVEWEGKNILVDASLDFRQQALREKIMRLDAVLITHAMRTISAACRTCAHIPARPETRCRSMVQPSP